MSDPLDLSGWTVNRDGSASPPRRTNAQVFPVLWSPWYPEQGGPQLVWNYDIPGGIGVNYPTFEKAARALLEALEAQNVSPD